ncbi:MAG: hypothetical protein ABI255_08840 [Microbacteriaceae bacterium]
MSETVQPPMVPGEPAPKRRLGARVLIWSLLGLLLVAALISAVAAASRELYSASGLVDAYLTALAQHQPAAALALPGVDARQPSPDVSRELLRGSALGVLTDIELTESAGSAGTRLVTARYLLDSVPGTCVFTVKPAGAWLGVFPSWRFATNPLAVVTVTVAHAHTFTLAGLNVDPRAADARPTDDHGPTGTDAGGYGAHARYLMFAPARYTFGHASALLSAEPVTATITPGSENAQVHVVTRANRAFNTSVQKEVDRALDACAAQHTLQPAGCPFGIEIDDRVDGAPNWTIVRYPTVQIEAGRSGWQAQGLNGVAQVQATVRSLFDGSITPTRRNEPFTMNIGITIEAEDAIAIIGQ